MLLYLIHSTFGDEKFQHSNDNEFLLYFFYWIIQSPSDNFWVTIHNWPDCFVAVALISYGFVLRSAAPLTIHQVTMNHLLHSEMARKKCIRRNSSIHQTHNTNQPMEYQRATDSKIANQYWKVYEKKKTRRTIEAAARNHTQHTHMCINAKITLTRNKPTVQFVIQKTKKNKPNVCISDEIRKKPRSCWLHVCRVDLWMGAACMLNTTAATINYCVMEIMCHRYDWICAVCLSKPHTVYAWKRIWYELCADGQHMIGQTNQASQTTTTLYTFTF